jgi:hypothetical protein
MAGMRAAQLAYITPSRRNSMGKAACRNRGRRVEATGMFSEVSVIDDKTE